MYSTVGIGHRAEVSIFNFRQNTNVAVWPPLVSTSVRVRTQPLKSTPTPVEVNAWLCRKLLSKVGHRYRGSLFPPGGWLRIQDPGSRDGWNFLSHDSSLALHLRTPTLIGARQPMEVFPKRKSKYYGCFSEEVDLCNLFTYL
jgi:hypothetical protein